MDTTEIRKRFFALRNGIVADVLRKGGSDHKYIFGLQIPQIKAIADEARPDSEEECAALARSLWADRECREARLLACHLMPPALTAEDEALAWAEDARSREEADILAFRLIRHLPYAAETAATLKVQDSPLKQYTATAIQRFLD